MQLCARPSYALQNIRKKIENENPHVAKFALQVRMDLFLLTVSTEHCLLMTFAYKKDGYSIQLLEFNQISNNYKDSKSCAKSDIFQFLIRSLV